MQTLFPPRSIWGETIVSYRARYAGPDEIVYGARQSSWAWIGREPFSTDGWEVVKWIQGHCCYTTGLHAREPVRLRNWQIAEVVEMFRKVGGKRVYRRGLLGLPRKNGKVISHEALVPTTYGMRRHGDLRVGDMVFDARGNPRKVLALGPEVMCDREVTFCGGESVVTHDDHEWSVFWPESAPLHRIVTRELPALIRDAMAKGQRVSVPIASPVTGIQLDLPCDPYLIGLWLGDGSTNQAHLSLDAPD